MIAVYRTHLLSLLPTYLVPLAFAKRRNGRETPMSWDGDFMTGLRACCATAALLALSTPAIAGGFAVREQSAEYQGSSFAGNATSGGGLSGMFWNPAVAAYAPAGMYSEAHYSGIFGHVSMTGTSSSLSPAANAAAAALPSDSGNVSKNAIVPASYMSYRIDDRWVLAMSINSPFGLATEPSNRIWSGQVFARTSEIKTYTFTPTLAYKIMPTLSVGVGVQIEHMTGVLKQASGLTAPTAEQNTVIKGTDTALGFTAGVNWTPAPGTAVGLGWRSSINHNLRGEIARLGTSTASGIQATINTPDIVSLSLRQAVTERFALLATGEWSNWSRADKLDIVCARNGAPGGFCAANGNVITTLPLAWHDGWMVALGGEYQLSDAMKLRSGVAYEISPIQNAEERTQRVPDVDRLWLSAGASYKWSEKVSFDLGYSHIFGIGDGSIERDSGTPGTASNIHFSGKVSSHADIVSASMKMKIGDIPVAYEPVK